MSISSHLRQQYGVYLSIIMETS